MEKLVIKDSSVEKAIQKGLIKLNITMEQADVVVKEQGKKGLFGFGQKDAVIEIGRKEENIQAHEDVKVEEIPQVVEKVTVVEDIKVVEEDNELVNYLEAIVKEYGATNVTIKLREKQKKIMVQIDTDKVGLLIGKHGKIINALQILAQTFAYKKEEKSPVVVVNIGDYRQRREEKLKDIADRTAKKVLKMKQAVFLEPLPAFERKIIHARLSKYEKIATHSEGKEPYRYLVVEYAE